MIFSYEGKDFELKGIQRKQSKLISSSNMKKLLKKGHLGFTAQLFSSDVQTPKPYVPLDLQRVIYNHPKVFAKIPKVIPPT